MSIVALIYVFFGAIYNNIKIYILFITTTFLIVVVTSGCKKAAKHDLWKVTNTITKVGFILRDLEFINASNGYIIGSKLDTAAGKNCLWVTNDGGNSWSPHFFFIKDNFINNISATSSGVFGCGNQLYGSLNEGNDWTNIYPGLPFARISALHFLTNDNGFFSNNSITMTLDGGKTWKRVFTLPFVSYITKMIFTENNTAYAVGGSKFDSTNFGFVIKSTDNGQSWQLLPTNFKDITDVCFINEKIGFIFTANNELIKTNDGGITWKLINSTLAEAYPISSFLSENEGYYIGELGIYHSLDGGVTWIHEYMPLSNDKVIDITTKSGETIAITQNGLILKKQ